MSPLQEVADEDQILGVAPAHEDELSLIRRPVEKEDPILPEVRQRLWVSTGQWLSPNV